jgi:hypothetical protein
MKRIALCAVLSFAAAGYVFLQTVSPAPELASLMPGGAVVYLESPDFGRLLREWDASTVKANWLASANYAVFSRSNLFNKLQDVYNQYGEAAGFLPDLGSLIGIAGTDSALALYEIRDVEFLYISRIPESALMKSELWGVRDQFEQRQAGGVTFYLRTERPSGRTVAFAFSRGYLFLATRDDLVAQALELLARSKNPSIASNRWYREATAAAPNAGELRMVLNLESLVKSVYFRSYWVQRNVSAVRQYWTEVADVTRSASEVTESRALLRIPGTPEPAQAVGAGGVSNLLALVPPDAGLYKASRLSSSSEAAAQIVNKLIGAQARRSRDERYAPVALPLDSSIGTEGDLETRIDEQPLPADTAISDSVAAVRALLDKTDAQALLLVQSSAPPTGTFVQLPSVIVLEGSTDWDRNSVRSALAAAAGKLWTTSQLGVGWVSRTSGRHAVDRLNGLGALIYTTQGRLLFLSNDSPLLATVLDRAGIQPAAGPLTYAAGFGHSRERDNYERIMAALDFGTGLGLTGSELPGQRANALAFFSGNLTSVGQVLSNITEIRVTEEERGAATLQTVVYQQLQ